MWVAALERKLLDRYLLVWLVALSALAYSWPSLPGIAGIFDPFASKVTISPLITLTMFTIGLMLPKDEVQQVFLRWPTVLIGAALQYTAMPALAFLMGRAWGLTGDHLIGVIMVGCVPGAMASNVLTLNARGNASYSVSLTTTATLLSPIIVPIVMKIALSESIPLDAWAVSRLLLLTVVLPVVAGHLLSRYSPRFASLGGRWGSPVANLAILWIIAVVVGLNRDRLAQFQLDVVAALLCINLLGYSVGYAGGLGFRLPESMRRALTLEVGMQNAGLGASLATELFPDRSAVAIAPAFYTFGCMLTGTLLARMWASRRAEAGEGKE